ncbi:MAG: exosortase C-terminal domain/associated protein EpsI [Vicinamibacterales bacterium]
MTARRPLIALALLLVTGVFVRTPRDAPSTWSGRPPEVPLLLDGWRGVDVPSVDEVTPEESGADRVTHRLYTGDHGQQVGLYLAWYGAQRPGSSIHSPLHCLPGTGWSILSNEVREVGAGPVPGALRRLVATRGRDRIVVLYWYAIHGRMVASELWSRLYLLHDGLRFGRNDALLVRLVLSAAPGVAGVAASPGIGGGESGPDGTGLAFLKAMAPYVHSTSSLSARAWP